MIGEWLSDQGILLGPAVALFLFFGVFLGMLAWIFRPGSRQVYDRHARLPLDDGHRSAD